MRVLLAGRRAGKTTRAIDWVKGGVRTNGYPGWTRVLVVASRMQYDHIRREFWAQIEDFDHRVYVFKDWYRARGTSACEVRIDNLDMMLGDLLGGMPGMLTGFTLTGERWEEEDEQPDRGPRITCDLDCVGSVHSMTCIQAHQRREALLQDQQPEPQLRIGTPPERKRENCTDCGAKDVDITFHQCAPDWTI